MKLIKNNIKLIVLAISILIVILISVFATIKIVGQNNQPVQNNNNKTDSKFLASFVKEMHKENTKKDNFLVSPYSVEIALNMLMEGAKNNSREEIANVISSKTHITNESVKDANAAFIREQYKKYITSKYLNNLSKKYNAEILFDKYENPDKINKWVNKKTDKMIDKVVDELDDDFVLGLVNAIAIDAHWKKEFNCNETTEEKFTTNNKNMNVEMMHQNYKDTAKYYDGEDKGIILPYKENLDFIAIMPKDGIDNYLDNLSSSVIDDMLDGYTEATYEDQVYLSIPRFKYKYDLKAFKKVLENIGIKEVFDKEKADLTGIISREKLIEQDIDNLYVSKAVHKTNIDFNEKGTKAAAVTYLEISKYTSSAVQEVKIHEINFNKPFIYIIRDRSSHEVLFFGAVYTPNKWNGSTCSEE